VWVKGLVLTEEIHEGLAVAVAQGGEGSVQPRLEGAHVLLNGLQR
jgi:hypothetical protein